MTNEENLKSYYRKLLLKYHPDTSGTDDDGMIKQLIEEYHKLTKSKHSPKESAKQSQCRQSNIEHIKQPESIDDVKAFIMECIKKISENRIVQISTRAIEIYSIFARENVQNDNICATLTVIGYIREFWESCTKQYDMSFENVCRKLMSYAKDIVKADNYFEMLAAVNEPKQHLTEDIFCAIRRVKSEGLQKMLNAILIFVMSLEM